MGNHASSSFLTFLNNASVHTPEVFILKSILLIVLFGKNKREAGRKKSGIWSLLTQRGGVRCGNTVLPGLGCCCCPA